MNAVFEYLKSTRDVQFSWGSMDCFILTATAVELQTGVNPMERFIDKYYDEESAMALMKAEGYENAMEAWDDHFSQKHRAYATTGDPVLLKTGEMGVKTPHGVWVITAEGGREKHPSLHEIEAVWEVKWQ